MTRVDFIKVMAALTAGTGKDLSADAKEVYFDCLNDLSVEVFGLAAKRVLMEHRWATFPSIAELREAAAETQRGTVKELSSGEAWALAWRAVGGIDPEVSGSYARGVSGLPPLVVEAMDAYGINPLCYGKEPVGVIRGQFIKIYDQLAAREKRRALLPASLTAQIEAHAPNNILQLATARIGEPNNGTVRVDARGAAAVRPRGEEERTLATAASDAHPVVD